MSRQSFEQRLHDYLAARYPRVRQRFGSTCILELITHGIDRAKHYGFRIEADMANYCDLMFRFGPEFDCSQRSDWARPFLMDRKETGSLRMQRILCAAEKNRILEVNSPVGVAGTGGSVCGARGMTAALMSIQAAPPAFGGGRRGAGGPVRQALGPFNGRRRGSHH